MSTRRLSLVFSALLLLNVFLNDGIYKAVNIMEAEESSLDTAATLKDTKKHILGSHTVKLLQVSSCSFAESKVVRCIPELLGQKIGEPIVGFPLNFKGHSPWTVEIGLFNDDGETVQVIKEVFPSSSGAIRVTKP